MGMPCFRASSAGSPWRDRDTLGSVVHPGDIFDGKYRIVRLVGEGGMGAVYEGRNIRLDRPVAIKLMHADIARDRQAVARFEREAQAAARIGSRHIVDVLDLGELRDGERYMVMEYLEGETLAARIKRVGTMGVPEAARIGVQLLEGLTKVHDAGIVHRDLKPPNIFLIHADDSSDFVKILDFGVCKIAKSMAENGPSTGVGDVLGTIGYMAPEQLEHGPAGVDARADLYAVGVLLYRAVAGQLPYAARSLIEHMSALRERRCAPLTELAADADPKFSAIVERAIEWDREARFQDAPSLHRALVGWIRSNEDVHRMLADFLEREHSPATVVPAALPRPEPTKGSSGARLPLPSGRDGDGGLSPESLEPTRRVHVDEAASKLPKVVPPPRPRRDRGSARPPMPSLSDLATAKLPPRPSAHEDDLAVDVDVDFDPDPG